MHKLLNYLEKRPQGDLTLMTQTNLHHQDIIFKIKSS